VTPARFSWRCSRCRRFCDEPVSYGWGPAWSSRSCGQTIDLEAKQELDGRVVSVKALPIMNVSPSRP
jgi:hypothetical protein